MSLLKADIHALNWAAWMTTLPAAPMTWWEDFVDENGLYTHYAAFARYAAGEIRVDGSEVEDAGWYPADDMPMIFPGNVSIAQWLIREFLERHR